MPIVFVNLASFFMPGDIHARDFLCTSVCNVCYCMPACHWLHCIVKGHMLMTHVHVLHGDEIPLRDATFQKETVTTILLHTLVI